MLKAKKDLEEIIEISDNEVNLIPTILKIIEA